MRCNRVLDLVPVDSEHLENLSRDNEPEKYKKAFEALQSADGILVPGKYSQPALPK